ncbi:MAG: response regulator [Elusimicrobia bacterium]|nr:response regulator [Candidatus Obscuribacterium magneticum]
MLKSSKILVVDDEPGIRELLSRELGVEGYSVAVASDGIDALELIKREKYQVILSDVKMPKLGGIEMLEAVKKTDPDVEVIIMTGYGTIETAVEAMKRGAVDFVQKPFNLSVVKGVVKSVFERRELKAIVGVYEASRAIFSHMEPERLLNIIVNIALNVLRANDVTLFVVGKDGQLSKGVSSLEEASERRVARLALGARISAHFQQWKEPLVLSEPLAKVVHFSNIPKIEDIEAAMIFPLVVNGELLGALNANRTSKGDPFTAEDARSATIFSSQMAQAVYNARLFQALEEKVKKLKEANDQLERTKAQLLQSEKLAALGQLAASVAHELNNPLTGIMGFSQLLLEGSHWTPQQQEDLEGIYNEGKRCRGIIQSLLKFSRRREPKKEPCDIVETIDEALALIDHECSMACVQIEKEYPIDHPVVYGDPSQLQQVFINISKNAVQAMKAAAVKRLIVAVRIDGDRVIVSFRDSGCGIPVENLSKVFDPFFTTKPAGEGTGLGLSVSYGLIQDHRGKIYIDSEEGGGTTVTIELPIAG